MRTLAVCLFAGALQVAVPTRQFTLSWRHTVEKVLWEEDYVVANDGLLIVGARIRGSGAGMEPPADAVLTQGVWTYTPQDRWRREVILARSEFGADYQLCINGHCEPVSSWLPGPPQTTTLRACSVQRADAGAVGRRYSLRNGGHTGLRQNLAQRWKIVPIVTDTRRRQPSRPNRPSLIRQLRAVPQRGHTKPAGPRSHSR